jgi:probable F420-dependent oxidoreductase
LLNGEQVNFAGRHYHVTGHTIAPRPVQKPHPPILIGGNGRLLLALAAREADIVGFSGLTFRNGGAAPPDLSGWLVSGVDARVRLVREAAGEARYAQLELNALVQLVVVTNDRRQAAEDLASRWTQLTPDEILHSPYVLIGTIDQMAEDLQAYRNRWGISYYVVHEPYMDIFAPVVARLAGG